MTRIDPPDGWRSCKAWSSSSRSVIGFGMTGRGTGPARRMQMASAGRQAETMARASSMARSKFFRPSTGMAIEAEPSMTMATSRSPPASDHCFSWNAASSPDVPSAKSTSAPATASRVHRARRLDQTAAATPANIDATSRAGSTAAHGMDERLGRIGSAMARTSSARARHRSAIRMISSSRIRRRRMVSESSRNRMAPQSTRVARWRFSRWMMTGIATATSPISMAQLRNIMG